MATVCEGWGNGLRGKDIWNNVRKDSEFASKQLRFLSMIPVFANQGSIFPQPGDPTSHTHVQATNWQGASPLCMNLYPTTQQPGYRETTTVTQPNVIQISIHVILAFQLSVGVS